MQRKSYSLLVLGVLIGAAATGFLVVELLGEEAPKARSASASARDLGDETGNETPPKPTVIRVERERRGGSPSRGSGGGVLPGKREPRDSPGTIEERREWHLRVLEILNEIQDAETSAQRQSLYLELKKLIRRLGHRVSQSVRDDLLKMLITVDPIWRPLVGDTIGQLRGDTDTAKKLVDMFKDRPKDVRTRRAILAALGNMKVEEVVPDLLKLLRADHEDEDSIVRAIGGIGGPKAAAGLLEQLDHPLIPKTRIAIEAELGRMHDPVALEKIVDRLPEADPKTRTSYLQVLGATRDARYADAVRAALDGERDPRARKAAIRALGMFGDAKSGEVLLGFVERGSAQERADATRAIFAIRRTETVEALAGSWNRLGEDARVAVMGAGARLARPGKKLTELAIGGLRDNHPSVRNFSVQVLGKTGNDAAVDPIVNYMRGATGAEVATAMASLLNIKTRKAAEAGLSNLGVLRESQRAYYREQFEKIATRYRTR